MMTATVTGHPSADMDELIAGFGKRLETYVLLIAVDVMGVSKAEAPIDTGFLRGSIDLEQTGRFSFRIVARASYAAYVHDGTRFINANPYMSRARLFIIAKWSGKGFELS